MQAIVEASNAIRDTAKSYNELLDLQKQVLLRDLGNPGNSNEVQENLEIYISYELTNPKQI